MSAKRPPSPNFITNPFIKKKNLAWTIEDPDNTTDNQEESDAPPSDSKADDEDQREEQPNTAAIESGDATVTDHLTLFSKRLAEHTLASVPVLPVLAYSKLYKDNVNTTEGAHFVIHQHDHPIAGTHYDLRLQINETSSVSWAIMYGLPGDPNSVRLNRNATETRIHCLWNHLIETASSQTGSLLIWDTGTYSILPYKSKRDPKPDPSSPTASFTSSVSSPSQQSLLHDAFQRRKIRLRLHGSRLPDPYIINLRLTRTEDIAGRAKSSRRPTRRRTAAGRKKNKTLDPEETSNDDSEGNDEDANPELVPKGEEAASAPRLSAMERELREMEDEEVRRSNAYPGATNTIGSVHQRKWYLSLDRAGCGFVQTKRRLWQQTTDTERPSGHAAEGGNTTEQDGSDSCRLSYPFYVRGAEHERSIVTGRRGGDILRDEGVIDFVQRKGWKPVVN